MTSHFFTAEDFEAFKSGKKRSKKNKFKPDVAEDSKGLESPEPPTTGKVSALKDLILDICTSLQLGERTFNVLYKICCYRNTNYHEPANNKQRSKESFKSFPYAHSVQAMTYFHKYE